MLILLSFFGSNFTSFVYHFFFSFPQIFSTGPRNTDGIQSGDSLVLE
jgi:hypothetical protein